MARRNKKGGWYKHPNEHALASRGIKTVYRTRGKPKDRYLDSQKKVVIDNLKEHNEFTKRIIDKKIKESGYELSIVDYGVMDTVVEVYDSELDESVEIWTQPDVDNVYINISEETGVPLNKVSAIILDDGQAFDMVCELREYEAYDIALDDAWQYFEE